MGKNRHSKDRLFITQTEHKYLYGGKKAEVKKAYRRLPFDCCAITLSPFKNPVCTPEGHLFDLEAVVPYVKEHQINPVNGQPLTLKDLIKLKFSKNSEDKYFCPVTYKVFTDNTKIAAISTTGNVFAYEAIEELNIKPKNWTDLLSGETFKRKDIIILQDPQDLSSREIENFEHLRRAKEKESCNNTFQSFETKNIRTNAATERILKELEAKMAEKKKIEEKIRQGSKDITEKDKIIASLTHSNHHQQQQKATKEEQASGTETERSKKLVYSKYTTGEMSRSFTSSAMTPMTLNLAAIASQDELHEQRWFDVRKMKKKGYVRLVTNKGDINLEIDCDFVPRTADNFMTLCERGYYEGTIFHRIIQGFMMQGGDPTGTGRGGESAWKTPFRDEIDSRLSHDKRGVLSMANSGPNTNRSQFFITFKACPHLDKKHSIFGRVVGGMNTLDVIEKVATDVENRPTDEVKLLKVEVFTNPFKEYEEAQAKGLDVSKKASAQAKATVQNEVKGVVLKVGDDWVAYDGIVDVPSLPTGNTTKTKESCGKVGKYLASKKRPLESKAAPAIMAIEGKQKDHKIPKKTSGFGNFSGW